MINQEMVFGMQLKHPNIIKYYGYITNDAGQIVLVMERVERSLFEQLLDDRIHGRLYEWF